MIFVPAPPAPPPAQRLALKIDVETYRGAAEGVPRLCDALRKHGAAATFFFNVGPDRSGRSLLRMGAGSLLRRSGGHSLLAHHGYRTLLYGTMLPGPDLGRRCADVMRRTRDQGYELGVHPWEPAGWQRRVGVEDAHWTAQQMQRAADRFEQILGVRPRVHAAPGCHMNVHAFRLTQRLGFDYCADTLGTRPYIPVVNAELIACPQIPTTLPTLQELMADEATVLADAPARMLAFARGSDAPSGHVYTARAHLEGLHWLSAFEQLLTTWRASGMELMSLGAYLEAGGGTTLPAHRIEFDHARRHRAGTAAQGVEFLPE